MRGILTIVLTTSLVSSSCEKEEELPFRKDTDGAVTSMPYQWKTSLSDDGRLIYGTLSPTIQYDGNILFASQKEGKDGNTLSMISTATGDVRWQWNDFFDIQKSLFDIRYFHQYKNHLVFQEGRQFYHLDLSNGTTLQKEERNYQADRMSGLGEEYFVAGNFILNQEGLYEGAVFAGNIVEQTSQLLIRPEFAREYSGANQEVGIVGSAIPFEDNSGDILLAYDYSDSQDKVANTYMSLYNYSEQKVLYDKKPLALGIALTEAAFLSFTKTEYIALRVKVSSVQTYIAEKYYGNRNLMKDLRSLVSLLPKANYWPTVKTHTYMLLTPKQENNYGKRSHRVPAVQCLT